MFRPGVGAALGLGSARLGNHKSLLLALARRQAVLMPVPVTFVSILVYSACAHQGRSHAGLS